MTTGIHRAPLWPVPCSWVGERARCLFPCPYALSRVLIPVHCAGGPIELNARTVALKVCEVHPAVGSGIDAHGFHLLPSAMIDVRSHRTGCISRR